MSLPLGGGNPKTLASGLNSPTGLALDASFVYVAGNGDGTIRRVPLGGGAPTTLALVQNEPWTVVIAGGTLYWNNYTTPNGSIMSIPIGGGKITTVDAPEQGPLSLVTDGTSLYWSELAGMRVRKGALPSGAPATLYPMFGYLAVTPSCLFVGAADVIWRAEK